MKTAEKTPARPSLAWIESPENLTVFLDFKTYTVSKSAADYSQITDALKNEKFSELKRLMNPEETIKSYVAKTGNGSITVSDGHVYYNGEEMHGVMVDKLFELKAAGFSVKHLIKFMENLMLNPSFSSRQDLYKFLEHKNLPITPDGTFLAYRAIRNDWTDKHTGKISNKIGEEPFMDRKDVDDNKNNGCSKGLHVGSLKYSSKFASNYGNPGGDRMIIVEVNPENVVSVPLDSNCEKCRTCRYRVVSEYTERLINPIYTTTGGFIDTDYEEENFDQDSSENEPEEELASENNEFSDKAVSVEDKKYAKAEKYADYLSNPDRTLRHAIKVGTIAKKLGKKVNNSIIIDVMKGRGWRIREIGKWQKDWLVE